MKERERWQPLLKTDGDIYRKDDKYLMFSKKEITLQTPDKIIKRKRPMEKEPRIENKLPTCGGCEKTVDITDPNKGYIKSGDNYFHLDHYRDKKTSQNLIDKIPETIIFRESEQPLESQLSKNASVYEAQKWNYENRKREMKKIKDMKTEPHTPH